MRKCGISHVNVNIWYEFFIFLVRRTKKKLLENTGSSSFFIEEFLDDI